TEAEPFDEPGPRIIYVNEAFTKLTGYTAEEVIGKSPRILQGPRTDKSELERLKTHLKNWEACEVTLVNYKKNGDEFWINFSITPVADDKGWFTHWVSIERDVTESKNFEIQKVLLAKISQLFNQPDSLTDTLVGVLENIISIGNYCAAEIWLVNKDTQELNLLTKYSDDEEMNQFYEDTKGQVTFKYGVGLPGVVWEKRTVQVWDIDTSGLNSFRNKAAQKAKIKRGLGIPLFNNDEVSGVLILGTRECKGVNGAAVLSENFGQQLGAEIKRKQLELELNQLFSFAPDIISISNFEGYFKKINPAACNLLEYTLEEFLSKPVSSFIHPDDRESIAQHLNFHRNKSETYYFENRFLTKSGRIKWLAWASNTLLEEGLIFSVAKDITDRKNLEDLLLKSNSMGKVGSWEIDIIGGTVYWSDITKEIRETEPGFIPTLETGIHYFKEGKDKETITKKVNECKTNGTPWDEELQIVTFKGNLKWIRAIGQAEMVNGKCIRIYGSFQDIDERKKAELKVSQAVRELEESEKRYSNLFHLSPLSMWVYDVETLRFLDVNQTAIKHYGYTVEEFLSMTIRDIRPVEELAHLEAAIRESSISGTISHDGVFIHRNKKGKYLNVEIKSNLILFKGKIAKVIVANDITERIAYFNALEQQNKKLQEISWIQSHVIRAPLSRLMGLVYLLKNKSAQSELSEESIIEHIEQSTEELDLKIKEIIEKSDHKEI
ncbi:MAG: PAS domain S-box protein, partial [Bacteroidia bacterium]